VDVSAVRLRFRAQGNGIRSWSVRGLPGARGAVDGLAQHQARSEPGQARAAGSIRLDQLVIATPDFDRTAAALAAAGLALKREQTLRRGDELLRQGFRRLGEPVLELVSTPAVPSGPARFWGLGFTVERLEELRERLGDRLGEIRPAVQPGRRIAPLRESAGVEVPIAFLDSCAG
jgi:hypothetical protein